MAFEQPSGPQDRKAESGLRKGGELVSLEGAARERNLRLMERLFELEDRFGTLLGRVGRYAGQSPDVAYLAAELLKVKEELVLSALDEADIPIANWTNFVQQRLGES